ncbi:hypothetical protein D3C79_734290 [compost metagenome]
MLEGVPHMPENRRWHVGVTHQVVGLAHQLVVGEPADGHERVVAVSDAAVQVGGRDQPLVAGKRSFMLSDGQIHAHLGGPCLYR